MAKSRKTVTRLDPSGRTYKVKAANKTKACRNAEARMRRRVKRNIARLKRDQQGESPLAVQHRGYSEQTDFDNQSYDRSGPISEQALKMAKESGADAGAIQAALDAFGDEAVLAAASEILYKEAPFRILFEGGKSKFTTGAIRSADCGQERYDLISPIGLRRLAVRYGMGGITYGDFNWERGMPIGDLLVHVIRHLYQYLSGNRDEDHLAAAAWGCFAAMHSEEMWPSLNTNLRLRGCLPPFHPQTIENLRSSTPPKTKKVRAASIRRAVSAVRKTTSRRGSARMKAKSKGARS